MSDTLTALVEKVVENPPHYYGDLDLDRWGFTRFSVGAGASIIDRSNFNAARDSLSKGHPGKSQVVDNGVDYIAVDITDEGVMRAVEALEGALERYPVLDDDDVSEQETEEKESSYDDWAKKDAAKVALKLGFYFLFDIALTRTGKIKTKKGVPQLADADLNPDEEDEEMFQNAVMAAMFMDGQSGCGLDETQLEQELISAFGERVGETKFDEGDY